MGWKVDYQKLKKHLENKYNVSKIFYYGGVETYHYEYDFTSTQDFPIHEMVGYLEKYLHKNKKILDEREMELLKIHIKRAKFYSKLKDFGYKLKLKPVKHIKVENGEFVTKANCDVDLTFDAMRLLSKFDRFILLSGDGDFEILLKHFIEQGKDIRILSNPTNTAKKLKQIFSKQFKDFSEIKESIEYTEK